MDYLLYSTVVHSRSHHDKLLIILTSSQYIIFSSGLYGLVFLTAIQRTLKDLSAEWRLRDFITEVSEGSWRKEPGRPRAGLLAVNISVWRGLWSPADWLSFRERRLQVEIPGKMKLVFNNYLLILTILFGLSSKYVIKDIF